MCFIHLFFECDLCDYETKRKSDIFRHKLVHIIKNVECEICNKKYKTEEQCESHKKSENHLKTCNLEIKALIGKINKIKLLAMERNKINFKEDFKVNMFNQEEKDMIKKITTKKDHIIDERDLYKKKCTIEEREK